MRSATSLFSEELCEEIGGQYGSGSDEGVRDTSTYFLDSLEHAVLARICEGDGND